jgi:enoyl-CoA hydratase/carnithine racemase
VTPAFETVLFTVADDHVATITLNRPEVLNAFNRQMCAEFATLWAMIREDDAIHAVVLRAAGDRAFSTGVDVKAPLDYSTNVWSQADPGDWLSPKGNRVWKPVVCAVHGMAAGGAFYWINESDIVICSPEATFFDPHVTYGLTAVLEPIGLAHRVPLGEALRIALMGLDERVSAERALAIGLVTEIVDRAGLWARAHQIAASIAAKPPAAVQGTVRAIWESLDVGRSAALARGMAYTQLGNPLSQGSVDRVKVAGRQFRIR